MGLNLAQLPVAALFDADSLQIGPLQSWFKLPFGLEALADISLTAQGIAGDRTMLAHSLDGQLQLNLRQGILSLRSDNTLIIQPFVQNDLAVSFDRGRITITPTTLRGPNLNAQLGEVPTY